MRAVNTFSKIKQRLHDRWDDALLNFWGGCNPTTQWYQHLETKIVPYQLPEVLRTAAGLGVAEVQQWFTQRRPEILELYRKSVYGRSPVLRSPATGRDSTRLEGALGGIATIKEVRLELAGDPTGPALTLLLFLPSHRKPGSRGTPVFLGLNFFGNHTVHTDPHIQITKAWISSERHTRGLPKEKLRGLQASSWPVEHILKKGYGLATAYCGEIAPDRPDGLELGIQHWFQTEHILEKSADSWGTVAAWAWGLSRIMDYLETDEEVAGNRVAVIGHSRLGKAALWAGAQDERFAMVISNESGCAGAALFRRKFRETISIINSVNPHWFCENFKQYNDRELALPVDQHMLLSLIAPRPLYVASAQLDFGADPMGEFLAAKHASQLYRFLGTTGLPTDELPPADVAVTGMIGYHMRKGSHAITLFDWLNFIDFADRHLRHSTV